MPASMSFPAAETVSGSSAGRTGCRPRSLAAAMPSRVRPEMNLVIAAIVYWNTSYMDKATDHMRQQGRLPNPSLLRHVSPLGEAIVLTGDYAWNSAAAQLANVRPLNLCPAKIRAWLQGEDASLT